MRVGRLPHVWRVPRRATVCVSTTGRRVQAVVCWFEGRMPMGGLQGLLRVQRRVRVQAVLRDQDATMVGKVLMERLLGLLQFGLW